MNELSKIDPQISNLIEKEQLRQQNEIDLIASENYAPQSVLEATGSILTNKYAEGYPGKRYYGGCQFVDGVEILAQERCIKLFDPDAKYHYHANVQPHSGSQANMAVYAAVLNPGDTILGMGLAAGGHLTHGHGTNFSGQIYKSVQYGVDPASETLDYDAIEELAKNTRPKIIVTGASAYSRIIDFAQIRKIADSCGSLLMADIAHISGLVAAGLHPNPVGIADFVTSTTHKSLRGPRGAFILCKKEFAVAIDKAIIPGIQGGPFMNVIAAKAVAFKLALEDSFKIYQENILKNANAMAQKFANKGYRIVSGKTENHLFILDLRSKNLTGKLAEAVLESVGITVSRSCVPYDTQKAWITSGIRIGSPAITTRGFDAHECENLVDLIDETLMNNTDAKKLEQIKERVLEITKKYPLFY